MASEHGFGDDGTKATRFCQSDHGNDQMNEQDEQVTHSGNSINTSKSRPIQAKLAIRHGQLWLQAESGGVELRPAHDPYCRPELG